MSDSLFPAIGTAGAVLAIGAAYSMGFAGMNAAANRMPQWLRRTLTAVALIWLAVIAAVAVFVIATGR